MERTNTRQSEMLHYLSGYMEKYFYDSCQMMQGYLETEGSRIWHRGLKCIIKQVLDCTATVQEDEKKGSIQYVIFSFLRSSILLNRIELRVETLDNGFYLDREETAGYCRLDFLEERFLYDLSLLFGKAEEKFIRIQDYERIMIKEQYAGYYDSVVYRMIKSLAGLIWEDVLNSGIKITAGLKLIYGELLDRAVVVKVDKQG